MLIHVRFSPELLDWFVPSLKEKRHIVSREQASRIHYHAIFESDVGVEAIKKRFQAQCKTLGLITKKGQENAYYGGVKEWSEDVSYACKDGDYVSTHGYSTEELEALRIKGDATFNKPLIVSGPSSPVGKAVVLMPAKKSVSMRAQFVRHLKEGGWQENKTLHHEYYDEKLAEMIDELTEFWANAFTTPQGAVCIEHAKWIFANDDVREIIKHKNRDALRKMLR